MNDLDYILPINNQPLVSSLSNYADFFAVASLHKGFNNWIVSHYSNVVFAKKKQLEFGFDDSLYDACPLCEYDVHSLAYPIEPQQFSLCIKQLIRQGFYVIIETNQIAVPGTLWYRRTNYMHRCLYYGFSEEQELFFLKTYLINRKYESSTISFDSFVNSTFVDGLKLAAPIHTIKLSNHSISINKNHILKGHTCYFHSTGLLQENVKSVYTFGLSATKSFHDIIEAAQERVQLDVRPVSLFYDHKVVQWYKIKLYFELGFIKESKIQDYYGQIVAKTHHFLVLYIKMTVNPEDEQVYKYLHDLLDSIVELEKKVYPILLSELRMCNLFDD